MKLKQLASNMTELDLGNGTIVLFSYETPVAMSRLVDKYNTPTLDFGEYIQYVKTNKKWSNTTTRHIKKWLDLNQMPCYNASVEQSVLDNLINEVRHV